MEGRGLGLPLQVKASTRVSPMRIQILEWKVLSCLSTAFAPGWVEYVHLAGKDPTTTGFPSPCSHPVEGHEGGTKGPESASPFKICGNRALQVQMLQIERDLIEKDRDFVVCPTSHL